MRLSSAASKQRVRILLPVWGKEYIDEFLLLGLPSLLSPGNLPSLTEACRTEFVFLSQAGCSSYILSSPVVQQMMKICDVEFIDIDDLILPKTKEWNLYGFTLTFAFWRGIQNLGVDMVNTHFVLLVSDLVYADGALRSLSRHINENREVVIAAALRARRYEAAKALSDPSYRNGATINISSRQLIRIAFQNLHPSLSSKIVNQPWIYSKNCQHFFWRVDENTMISRNFLAHPLCFKPQRYLDRVEGFCDYAFIPELCPNLDTEKSVACLHDSDDFAAVELQLPAHELSFSRLGRHEIPKVVDYLSTWTTKEHRLFSKYNFTFHASELPANLGEFKAKADSFIEKLQIGLSATQPAPGVNNPHWLIGVEHFKLSYDKKSKNIQEDQLEAISDRHLSLDEYLSANQTVGKASSIKFDGIYSSELLSIVAFTLTDEDGCLAKIRNGVKKTACRAKNIIDQAYAISFHYFAKLRSAMLKQRP